MKQENRELRALFDSLSPTAEQKASMEQRIRNRTAPRKTARLRPMMIAAALVVIFSISVAAAPALLRYFFPGVGIVTVPADGDTPPYLILNTETDSSSVKLLEGYWMDGTAHVWLTSAKRLETLSVPGCEITLTGVTSSTGSAMTQRYRILFSDVSAAEAMEGIPFDGSTIRFDRMPAQYHPYTVEDAGLRLTLIPMSEDLTTFAAEVAWIDGRGEIELRTKNIYDTIRYDFTMALIDAEGNRYPLKKLADSELYSIRCTPEAPIVGFYADELVILSNYDYSESTTVTVTVPESGTLMDANAEFFFPDGKTVGRIRTVSRDTGLDERIAATYPKGYLAVETEITEQDGIRYWYNVGYADKYQSFLSGYLVTEARSPYDTSPSDPMSDHMNIGIVGDEETIRTVRHYIPDGSDTVELMITNYQAIVPGSWSIDFTK